MNNKHEAEALWTALREAFANTEKIIIEIIETRAWEPLGYPTFAAAWNDRLRGMRLATEAMRVQVVYAMLDSGLDQQEVIEATGVGDRAVANLARQRDSGVPAPAASTRVREHDRVLPSAPRMITVELSPGELDTFKGIARARGLDLHAEAATAVRKHFRSLARVRAGAQ